MRRGTKPKRLRTTPMQRERRQLLLVTILMQRDNIQLPVGFVLTPKAIGLKQKAVSPTPEGLELLRLVLDKPP